MRFSKSGVWTHYILCMFILSFYYLSYRYPLKYNSSETSFSYSDTPAIFQVGKYAIFAGFSYIIFMILLSFKKNVLLTKSTWRDIALSLYICLTSIIMFVISKNDYVLQTGIFFITLVLFYIYPYKDINYRKIITCIRIFVYVSILMEAYQLFNYYVNERLPALGYPNSTSVRFGSIWDDPNAFAMMVSFLFVFVMKDKMSRLKKLILLLSLFTILIYTLSLTGIAAVLLSFPIGYTVLYLVSHKKNYLKRLVKLFMLGILIAAVYKFIVEPSAFFQDYMYSKQASIEARKVGFTYFNDIGSMLGFNAHPIGKYSETAYINLLLNFGVIYLFAYLFVCISTIYRLALIIKNYNNHQFIQLFYAAFFFMMTFMLGMVNSPLDTVFPLNVILIICIMLSYTKKLPTQPTLNKNTSKKKRKKLKIRFKKIVW
ncbi:hypothetical protein ACEPPU_24045 [Priestia aryabhattai]|uniref:hypothetical protein n=1 Tax=Priestia aryabhattai TaxID=412384 RepID=UPI0035ABB8E2